MTPLVHLLVIGNLFCPPVIGWDHSQGSAFVQLGSQPVGIESLVTDEGVKIDPIDHRFNAHAVMALSRQKNKAHQIAQRIHQGDDLGGQAASRAADGLMPGPPFAPGPWR